MIFYCHTPARALKIALDASVPGDFSPTTTGGLWLEKAKGLPQLFATPGVGRVTVKTVFPGFEVRPLLLRGLSQSCRRWRVRARCCPRTWLSRNPLWQNAQTVSFSRLAGYQGQNLPPATPSCLLLCLTRTSTEVPGGVWTRALASRFTTTWWMAEPSPVIRQAPQSPQHPTHAQGSSHRHQRGHPGQSGQGRRIPSGARDLRRSEPRRRRSSTSEVIRIDSDSMRSNACFMSFESFSPPRFVNSA
jgi:hypothetical protein